MDNLEMYQKILKDNPNLEEKRESKLIKKAQGGDQESKDIIVKAYQRLILRVTRPYFGRVDYMDIVIEGNIALLEAIKYYDKKRKAKFLSYAWNRIVWRVKKYIITTPIIRLPLHGSVDIAKIPPVCSINLPISESGITVEDFIPAVESDIRERMQLESLTCNLNPRLKAALTNICNTKNMSQAGKAMGISRERVRQLRNEAIGKMQKMLRRG